MISVARPHVVVAPVAAPAPVLSGADRVAKMFDAHYDAIWRTLRRLGVAEASVDDAAQRVFMVAAQKLDILVPGGEGRFLYGVALRVASEHRRRDPARREIADEAAISALADEAPGPEQALLDHEARAALDATLDAMPHDLREILVLVEIEGLAVTEIATMFEIPIGTASSRLRRAREAFTESARRVRARLARGALR
jgi:RNA polymerase sigma-70 factor (ECF subfamily)